MKISRVKTMTLLALLVGPLGFAYFTDEPVQYGFAEKWCLGSMASALIVSAVLMQELVRTLKTARAGQQVYRDLFESVNDLILKISSNGKLLFANRACLETLGYRDDEFHALSITELVHDGDLTHVGSLFRKAVAGAMTRDIAHQKVKEMAPQLALSAAQATLPSIRFRLNTKTGKSCVVEGKATCRFERGQPITIGLLLRDVQQNEKWSSETITVADSGSEPDGSFLSHSTNLSHLPNQNPLPSPP